MVLDRHHLTCYLLSLVVALTCCIPCRVVHALPPLQSVTHGLPPLVQRSRVSGVVPANETIRLALVLPLRNQAQLDNLLQRLYTPGDPAYGHYLTPAAFTAGFGPSQADYNAVIGWARVQGLVVTQTYSNRRVVDVLGPARVVEQAFNVQLWRYQAPDGRVFRAPNSDAQVPAVIAERLSGVFGLDTAVQLRPALHSSPASDWFDGGGPNLLGATGGHGIGFTPQGGGALMGPGGGLSPFGIQTAYDLTKVTQTGAGQSLALVELDGYSASDITSYEQQFGITAVPLQNVLIDGFDGNPGGGAFEVTVDIEMMVALAPGANNIQVYMSDDTYNGFFDILNQIATDDLARQISCSWLISEDEYDASYYDSETTIFQQMAAQGQSMYAASGDKGSVADPGGHPNKLCIYDPASQPYVTGVGGTMLTTNSDGTWNSETTWNDSNGVSTGGVSAWANIPKWQVGVFDSTVTFGSRTKRNVPDVALNAGSPYYSGFFDGGWYYCWGTSFASPLWAAFTALVNQARVADNCPVLGFANPPIYYLATFNDGENYNGVNGAFADFHDITSGTNSTQTPVNPNYYSAVVGYDNATGWGSFVGANLLSDLTSIANTGVLNQLAGDSGFEQADANIAPWISTPNVICSSPAEPAHSGLWMAWLCGYGTTHTDTLMQTVHIPALATAATLSFYLHIDTAETTTTAKNDTLQVQLRDTSGHVLTTLGSYSNLNANVGYALQTYPLTQIAQYAGQTLQIYLVGSENNSLQTSFVVDDFALTITE
jgi:kumamolisin